MSWEEEDVLGSCYKDIVSAYLTSMATSAYQTATDVNESESLERREWDFLYGIKKFCPSLKDDKLHRKWSSDNIENES